MRGEIPQFRRCCCCMPLRIGLMAWAYVKLALDLLSISYPVLEFYLNNKRYEFEYEYELKHPYEVELAEYHQQRDQRDHRDSIIIAKCTTLCVVGLGDICFNIVLIVAGHRKSAYLLRITNIYNMVCLSVVLLNQCYITYRVIRYMYGVLGNLYVYDKVDIFFSLLYWIPGFCCIFVQIYVILLIRSEMMKLQNQNLEIQFTNITSGEPRCTLHKTSTCHTEEFTGEKIQGNSAATQATIDTA